MARLKIFALAGAMALATGAALAADIGYAPPPPPHFPPPAPAEIGGNWYLRGDVGVGATQIDKFTPVPQGTFITLETVDKTLSEQVFAGVGVGYRFSSWGRFDVTGEYRGGSRISATDYVTFDQGGGNTGQLVNRYGGDWRTGLFMANGYLDLGTFCQLGCVTPFVGVGLGVANHNVRGFTDSGAGQTVDATGTVIGGFTPLGAYAKSTSKTEFAWALHAGIGYEVNRNLTLEIAYRYVNMGDGPDMRLRSNRTSLLTGDVVQTRGIDSHDVKIGMRWNLNCDCGPAPAYASPPLVRKY